MVDIFTKIGDLEARIEKIEKAVEAERMLRKAFVDEPINSELGSIKSRLSMLEQPLRKITMQSEADRLVMDWVRQEYDKKLEEGKPDDAWILNTPKGETDELEK